MLVELIEIPELRQDRVLSFRLELIVPSPENDAVYKPVDPDDPEVKALAVSIQKHGLREPLVITEDCYIISGHRRYVACLLAGLTEALVRIEPFSRTDDPDRFLVLLREHNRQRVKSRDEQLRESMLSISPEEAYQSLVDFRESQAQVASTAMTITGKKHRCEISQAKGPFLQAIQQVLVDRRDYWPLSDRAIHYALLNAPPLKHASKSESVYDNTKSSYSALTELLTRARLTGEVPMEAIADETRPVVLWPAYPDPGSFLTVEIDGFLRGYWRDLLQSQPNHIEIVCEKNTVQPICKRVAERYCLPLTSGRGYCSLPPRAEMVRRYKQSGKEKLVVLMLSDFDPDGEEIAHSLARSLRDDFGVEQVHPIKVALTHEQVIEYELPPQMVAKATSVNHAKFTSRFGENVFELEALSPATLQSLLTQAIDSVLDTRMFNAEVAAEREDATWLAARRELVRGALAQIDFDATEGGDRS